MVLDRRSNPVALFVVITWSLWLNDFPLHQRACTTSVFDVTASRSHSADRRLIPAQTSLTAALLSRVEKVA